MTLPKLEFGPGRLFVKPKFAKHGERIDGQPSAMIYVPDDAQVTDEQLVADGWVVAQHCQYRLPGLAVAGDLHNDDHPDDYPPNNWSDD